MFIRALSIALCCAFAAALTPLSAAGDDNDCALYLSGPGRTSAYDYSLNLLKGNFGYEGQHTCITYDAVNQAYLDARNRIVVAQPKGDWKPEDFASVGELILDISISLARTYGLTYEEIEKGLPLIDTSRTLIREVCPPVFSHVECRAGKYRRLDGLCNNLQHPTWGATNAPFQRLLGPLFADGINAPRISHTGRDLPLSRVVSRTMHPDDGFHDHAGTVMVIAWGQFMDHDYTLTGTPLDPVNRNDPEECCKRPPHLKHPYCNEIRVPEDDYFYRLFGVKCIDFVRGFPSPRPGCRLGSRVPFNTLTGAIDGNTVYGVTEKFARKLRTGYGGILRMNPVFKEYGLRDLLPLKLDIPDEGCTRPNKNMYCFEAGEIRVNEQLVLTVMHTLMAREHNRVATALAEVNPHWDDETLYQEARRINIAEIQHITYNEFLPILLGKDVMEKFGLVLEKEGYWDGYDPQVNPDVLDAFAAAAYRFGHSLLPTAVERWSKAHKFIASKRLSDLIRRPYDLYRAGVLDEYVMGLMNQVAQAMDDSITQEVTNHLFKKVGARFGMDLVSFNMQRGREFGLPGYMEFRKFCGLPGAETFQDLFGTMSNETVRKYESIFEHPIDVDLWSGGVSERPLPGSMLGPTFACVIATQFSYSRRGDRFWHELPNQPSTFTPEQLTEIRKARLARVICDNTDIIDTVQLYPMVLPDHELNPRVPCRSGIIPSIDFTKWAEPAPFRGAAKQFMTDAQITSKNHTSCEDTLSTTPTVTETVNNDNAKGISLPNSNCDTQSNFEPTSENNLVTLQTSANDTAQNNISNSIQSEVPNCTEDHKSTTDECLERLAVVNEIPKSDTVLKYVYKANEKPHASNKARPHPMNSLRKRRSLDNENKLENITANESKDAPLIVNYETIHSPIEIEGAVPFQQRLTGENIQNAALADFHIETLHDTKSPTKYNENLNGSSQSSEESTEKAKYENNKSGSNESVESANSSEDTVSAENDKFTKTEKKGKDHDSESASRENYESKKSHDNDNSKESNESNDSEENRKYLKNDHKNSSEDPVDRKNYITDNTQSKEDSFEKYKENDEVRPLHSVEENSDENTENSVNKESRENVNSVEDDRSSYKDNRESNEKQDYKDNEKTKYKHESDADFDNKNEQHTKLKPIQKNSDENKGGIQPRHEQVKDNDSKQEKLKHLEIPVKIVSKPPTNTVVDSGDFSYERIQVNDKGQVITVEDNDENAPLVTLENPLKYDTHLPQLNKQTSSEQNSAEYISDLKFKTKGALPLVTPENPLKSDTHLPQLNKQTSSEENSAEFISDLKFKTKGALPVVTPKNPLKSDTHLPQLNKQTSSEENSAEFIRDLKFKIDEEPIHINDGEVKPVVEIHSENNDNNEPPEESIKEDLKSNLDEDISLETLLGTKEKKVNLEKDDKVIKDEEIEKGDVKQEFERIPTDYKHKNGNQNINDKNIKSNSESHPNADDTSDTSQSEEGTLDTLKPIDVNYDEHLKFKFDDISIKLPEIKLPEDVLGYSYEGPVYAKKNNKPNDKDRYYQYNNDSPSKHKKTDPADHDDDDEHRYYGYFGKEDEKQSSKQKQDDPSEEENDSDDLYEKFVRERFGKKGSFLKRAENLEDGRIVPNDGKLYDTVKNILKQTGNLQKQADKSGDPNAGYMWTLEYGEKL